MAGVIFRGLLQPLPADGGGSQTLAATITIDETKCGTADTTDYPLLVSSTIATLKSTANGGLVADGTNGYDIGFYSDAACTTLLDFEIESWNATTGAIVAWVRVPTLSSSVDTVLYVGAGDATIVASQQNAAGTWGSYLGAWHLESDGYSSSHPGLSSRQLSCPFHAITHGAAQVGNGLSMTASSDWLLAGSSAFFATTASFTVEAWVKPTSFGDYRTILAKGYTGQRNYALFAEITTGKPIASLTQGGVLKDIVGASPLSTSAFSYIVGTYDGTTFRLYTNGAADGSLAVSGATDDPGNFIVGAVDGVYPFVGTIDEPRVSSTARSASYITATYNNISSPSTFYAVT
jgi:hypothetical protein